VSKVAASVALAAAMVLTVPGAGRAEETLAAPALAVAWYDPERALPFSDRMLADDLGDVLEPAGVAVEWAPAGPDAVASGSVLRIVLLAREAAGESDVMGSVQRRSLSRTAWISLPGVERALGIRRRPNKVLAAGEARSLSRALARVIAHELVHLLAPDFPHARDGLMAPRLGRRFLVAEQVPLSPLVAAALRSAAAGEEFAGVERIALAQP
jgi:hypothetical protein